MVYFDGSMVYFGSKENVVEHLPNVYGTRSQCCIFCWIWYALQEKHIVCRLYRGRRHFCGGTLSFLRSTAKFHKNMNATFAACRDAQLPSIYLFQFSNRCTCSRNFWNIVCLLCQVPFLEGAMQEVSPDQAADTNAKGGRHSWHFGIWDLVCVSMCESCRVSETSTHLNSVKP